MFIVLKIDVYNRLTKAKINAIMLNQVFGAMHQVEKYRSDLEQYQGLRRNPEVDILFTIKEPITPKTH